VSAAESRLRRILLLILLLAGTTWIQLTVVNRTVVDGPLRSDAGEYFSYAVNLRSSGIYSLDQNWRRGQPAAAPIPDKIRPPGYPLLLAALGQPRASDAWIHRVSLVQAGFGVLVVFLAYLLACRLLGPGLALVVGALCAINPHLSTISTYVLSESLFGLTLLLAIWTSLRALQRDSTASWLLAGLAWSACCLVRPTMQFLIPMMVIGCFLVPRLKPWRRGMLLALLTLVLGMGPWLVRNAGIREAPGSSLLVKSLVHGSYSGFMYDSRPESFGFPYRFDPDSAAASRDVKSALARIGGNFRREPGTQLVWYAIAKPLWFLSWGNVQAVDVLIYPVSRSPFYEDRRFSAMRAGSLLMHWPLMLLGLAGALLAVLRPAWLRLDAQSRGPAILVAAIVLYAIALHVVAAPFPRYSIPFRPLLFALALLVLQGAWRAFSDRRTGSGSVSASRP
jgi:4-amino-4-deoxy-L-arabinose transferase-like glycosyltransferase